MLSGKIAGARAGEWQGGHVRLGFDVGCHSRETGKEVWRVVFEGKDKRLKVYSDGRTERFDGPCNFPQSQPLTEVLRVARSRDHAKIDAAVSVFRRYATEAVSFTELAKHLNDLGFRSSTGSKFHGHHIGQMLQDPIYRGHYTWNKTHHGKFHRYTDGRTVSETNYAEKVTANAKADWVQSDRLFEPLIDTKTWAVVQAKVDGRTVRTKAPTNASLYLAGLLHCQNCGGRMVVGPKRKVTKKRGGDTDGRFEYICGTYQRYSAGKNRDNEPERCPCLRNGVFQDVLDGFVTRYLAETGQRLQLLTGSAIGDSITNRLEAKRGATWDHFCQGLERLETYRASRHRTEFEQLLARDDARRKEEWIGVRAGPGAPEGTLVRKYGQKVIDAARDNLNDPKPPKPHGFVAEVLACYRANFDRSQLDAEIQRLDAQHTALTHRYADLPTPRAKEKATRELSLLEERMGELERHRDDVAGSVEEQYREMLDLQNKVSEAKIALQSTTGERALRQRAEAVRQVVQRIECSFTATGSTKGGPGRTNARLVAVTVYPLTGEPVEFETTVQPGITAAPPRTRVVSR